jgi:hypothetical protein
VVPHWALRRRGVAASFDHLVGAAEQRGWHVKAERLGRFQIEHQLVFGRRLHRKVSGFLALEDAIDITGRLPERRDTGSPE